MVLTISVAVIAAIMVIVSLFLIRLTLQLVKTAKEIEKLAEMVRLHIGPISHDLANISNTTRAILESIHRQVAKVEDSISAVRDMSLRAKEFEEEILEKLSSPLVRLVALFNAFRRGFETFYGKMRSD
jgi:uncharacterized protein YoxC